MRYDAYYADGAMLPCEGEQFLAVRNPATEAVQAQVRECSAANLERAVQSAVRGRSSWGVSTLDERRAALDRLGEALQKRSGRIVDSLAREMGCPVWLGEAMQVPMALKGLAFARAALDEIVWQERIGNGLVERVPVGVIAAITPWNFPLHQIVAKVAAAIAAGCATVLKPSEFAPGAAWLFIEACHEAQLPAGVVNLVWGGAPLGRALVAHPGIDQVSFTGSTAVGRSVMAEAGQHLKRVTLELGGKSASVLLPDADLDAAVGVSLRMALANSGQACVSQSRLIVPRAKLAEVEERLLGLLADWPLGDPMDPATRLGPVANQRQFLRIGDMVEQALQQGARLVAGGPGRATGFERGWYCPVTLLSDVSPALEIAQDEAFGPVLALMPYDTPEQALALANSTRYGLSGAVWSADAERATAFARRMVTGQVIINGAPQNLATPFGGRRDSGLGRENGRFGVEECLTYRSLHGA
ncbi:aldehyde dehydrogenase family protein [Bordetella genomosp. 13]|uniref:aldehyde dehydrogenase family protein n=1 Tax=Bordetella genomosp. 13 TaxID=463040 RepID=UPI0021B5FF1A|nr:aldehyde dehydrogenase family protein [Bordetella genomosp. 13]